VDKETILLQEALADILKQIKLLQDSLAMILKRT
jgi:hypothetical protein